MPKHPNSVDNILFYNSHIFFPFVLQTELLYAILYHMMTETRNINNIKQDLVASISKKTKREKDLIVLLDRIRDQILGEDKEMKSELEFLKTKVLDALKQERIEIKQQVEQLAELESLA